MIYAAFTKDTVDIKVKHALREYLNNELRDWLRLVLKVNFQLHTNSRKPQT